MRRLRTFDCIGRAGVTLYGIWKSEFVNDVSHRATTSTTSMAALFYFHNRSSCFINALSWSIDAVANMCANFIGRCLRTWKSFASV